MTTTSDACLSEDEVLQLFEGRLSPERQARAESHIDGCPSCLDLVARSARGLTSPTPASDDGASVGNDRVDPGSSTLSAGRVVQDRYQILERVGIGAMGVVYAAFDRVLDRKVALKVLRPDRVVGRDARAQARLVREAKILARLSHPNVIVVYDVSQGEFGVVMAMELVTGRTLGAWLADRQYPSQYEILTTFLAVGRGLAAAHAAGVVHRDLKPDNVLVGDDGRVRVTDFGLAHSPRKQSGAAPPAAGAPMDESRFFIAGTPRYMAPEQYLGHPADASSDQFAFAVSLYEALYREPPFPLTSNPERLAAIRAGEFAPPARSGVSRGLRAALRRGLQADPARRFPSMDAMCDAIDPARRRRLYLIAGSAASSVVAGLLGALVLAPVPDPLEVSCEDAAQHLAGVWDSAVRRDLDIAIAATQDPGPGQQWADVARDLDATVTVWARQYDATCATARASTGAERDQAAVTLACLERSLEWLRTATNMAARADAGTLALLARRRLPAYMNDACGHPDDARRFEQLPVEPDIRQRVGELRMQLFEVWTLDGEGRLQEALALARRTADESTATGFAPVIAEALFLRGAVEHKMGALTDAQRTLERALATAETASHDGKIPEIWLELALLDIALGRFDEASRGLDRATAFYSRYPLSPATTARLGAGRASILRAQGRHREAIEAEAQRLASKPDNELEVASSLVVQAISHAKLGDLEIALDLNRRALTIRERHLGPEHSRVAGVLNNIGALLTEQGDYEEARRHLQRALAIREKLGVGSEVEVSHVVLNLGLLARERDLPGEARAHFERVLALREQVLGPDHILVADPLQQLGSLLVAGGEADAGWQYLERARTIRDRVLGPSHPATAITLVELARAELARAQPAVARVRLEAALAILATADVHPAERATANFTLAQVLDALGSEPPRARQLAEAARDAFRPLGRPYARQLAEVEAFLAARPAL